MPFYWMGALFALAFLAIVIAVFGILIEMGSRAATDVRASILPGLIVGIRDWTDDREANRPVMPPRDESRGASFDETPTSAWPRLERVRRR
jgi:hypothetical protein